jgi:hypothetical protein
LGRYSASGAVFSAQVDLGLNTETKVGNFSLSALVSTVTGYASNKVEGGIAESLGSALSNTTNFVNQAAQKLYFTIANDIMNKALPSEQIPTSSNNNSNK